MAAPTITRSITRFGKPPPANRRHWRDPETLLPRPPTNVITREYAPSRYSDHYYTTLQDDVMYMTYKHELGPRPPARVIRPRWDPEDPYTKHRVNPTIGGARLGKKLPEPSSAENVTILERIQIHTMAKEVIKQKAHLLGAIMAFRVLSGESIQGGGQHAIEGVQVVRGKKKRRWMVDMKGNPMYDFLGTLVEFVLPRLRESKEGAREFQGLPLPGPDARYDTPSATSGVVSFGLPPSAMALFPQIEVNVEQYPKMFGMHVHFITNASGVGAQDRARALVSGFGVPFFRR
ncbi:60s ribosomal protein l7 [Mycena floridula]|nr:60s ribosomal protein l7 [Mycena floridula]